jgi:hypothetical protein
VQRSEPPWPGAQAFRRRVVVGTMNDGENDLISGQCPWQGGHGMMALQYGHGIQVPLPPQNADNTEIGVSASFFTVVPVSLVGKGKVAAL